MTLPLTILKAANSVVVPCVCNHGSGVGAGTQRQDGSGPRGPESGSSRPRKAPQRGPAGPDRDRQYPAPWPQTGDRSLELLDSMRLDIETLPDSMHHHARCRCWASVRTLHCVASAGRVCNVASTIARSRSGVRTRRAPTPPSSRGPRSNHRPRQAQLPGNRGMGHSTVSQQDDAAFLGHPLRGVSRTHQGCKLSVASSMSIARRR